MRQFKVRSALVSISEAFPSDRNGETVRGHDIFIPGTFSSLNELWYALAQAIGSRYVQGVNAFAVSHITDDGFLLEYQRLVDHNEKEPSEERRAKWDNGEAFLFNARYLIEISCLEVTSLGAATIGKLLGKFVPESGGDSAED